MKKLSVILLFFSGVVVGKQPSLHDRLNTVLKDQLYVALKDQRDILPPGEAEKILLLLLKPEDISISIVKISDILEEKFEDRNGNPALLSDDKKRMLDLGGIPCQGRIVAKAGTKNWFIQLDADIWKEYLSSTDFVAPAVIRLLFHEILRLEWHRGHITSSDERSVVSNKLKIERVNLELTDFAIVPIGEGDEFVGEIGCERATFKEEQLFNFSSPYDFRRCKVRVTLKKNQVARYEAILLADGSPYFLVEEAPYSLEGRKLTLHKDEDFKVFDVGLNNDHISPIGEALFRVDRGAPSVLGKTFGAEMFCSAANIALLTRWSFWEPIHPGFTHYDKICTLELIINPSGDYMAVLRGTGPVAHVVNGKIEQIGHNLILKPKNPEKDTIGAYFWIARGRQGSELVSTWGETLFENWTPQRHAIFSVAKEYRGEGNCGFFPGKEDPEKEQCKITLRVNTPAEGLVDLELETKVGGEKHVERGIALRSGSIYAIWAIDKIKRSWNWRILKDQLVDGFGNRINAVTPTPVN